MSAGDAQCDRKARGPVAIGRPPAVAFYVVYCAGVYFAVSPAPASPPGAPPALRLDARPARRHALRMIFVTDEAETRRGALIAAIAGQGDRAAFAELFSFYAPRVKAQARRFGLADDAAEDVAQEAMLRVWRAARQFDAARGNASAWIFTIAVNARLDRLRRDARLAAAPLEGAALDLPDVSRQEEEVDGARLTPLLAALPVEQRRVMHLSFFLGASHGEIARALGVPLGTVKSRVRLALGRLRHALRESS